MALAGKWCAKDKSHGSWLVSFRGATPRMARRRFTARVLERCGLSAVEAEQVAPALLEAAFEQLRAGAGTPYHWLETEARQCQGGATPGIRVVIQNLGLRRCQRIYRCERTGQIWPREVLGCAPGAGCDSLVQVDGSTLDGDARVGRRRREFQGEVFDEGLWAEEHSAQLSPRENRRLQDLFRAGIRNILSSTTTMELGIDIGGLSAVLMGNVPPGKASYLQRAGRAGRRADGSSVVLTFAHLRPYDREVFRRFDAFLAKPFRSPLIFLDRNRVVRRHVHALLLGTFFRQVYPPDAEVGAMNAFGYMGKFCGVPLPIRWGDGTKPPLPVPESDWSIPALTPWRNPAHNGSSLDQPFRDFLVWTRDHGEAVVRPAMETLLGGTKVMAELADWGGFVDATLAAFDACLDGWRQDYETLLATWQSITEAAPRARAHSNALRYQMLALYEMTVIEALADRQFLPRYGFPIGVQKLRVLVPDEKHPNRSREEDQFRLERAGIMAIREYVPGSELLVGGKVVASRGLLKNWTGAQIEQNLGLRGLYAYCTQGHLFYEISGSLEECPLCGSEPVGNPSHLLLTRHGFTTAASEPPRYGADVERVGTARRATVTFSKKTSSDGIVVVEDFAGVPRLRAMYREDGELLVYNTGNEGLGFAICLKCGYADSESHLGDGAMKLPAGFSAHTPIHEVRRSMYCWPKEDAPVLRNQALAAREITDVVMLDFSECVPGNEGSLALVTTLAHALQIAGARVLQLDTRELGAMTAPAGSGGCGLGAVIYDNVPGGAGHVRELLDCGRLWLETARDLLFVSEEHDAACEMACLDCLLTFDAQEAMTQGLLRRRVALAHLEGLLSGIPQVGVDEGLDVDVPVVTAAPGSRPLSGWRPGNPAWRGASDEGLSWIGSQGVVGDRERGVRGPVPRGEAPPAWRGEQRLARTRIRAGPWRSSAPTRRTSAGWSCGPATSAWAGC